MDITEDRRLSPLEGDGGLGGLRLDLLLANLPGMAYRCLNRLDWCMVFVSQGCLALTGYSAGELVGTSPPTYADLIHPDDRQHVWDCVQDGVKRNCCFELEYRIRTRDGTVKWVWERGVCTDSEVDGRALEGFITDISARHLLADQLAARGEQLEGELGERVRELRAMVNAMAGREVRMAELKRENERLRCRLREHGLDPGPSEDGLL